jgi:hypothetical protein
MRGRVSLLFAATFAIFGLVYATKNAWTLPFFAALTFNSAALPYAAWRGLRGSALMRVMLARFTAMCYAMAWFFGLIVASPTHGAFWLVFLGVLAVGSPVVLLGWRYLLRESPGNGVRR